MTRPKLTSRPASIAVFALTPVLPKQLVWSKFLVGPIV
jgi:hypothetical protein